MARLLVSFLAAGSAAAQQITAFPTLPDGLVNHPVNTNDPEYAICTSADSIIASCVDNIGGNDAIETADPAALFGCVCCNGQTPVSRYYSTCAAYLFEEEPSLSLEASNYDSMYTICADASQFCSGSATATAASTVTSPSAIITDTPESTSAFGFTSFPATITATDTAESIPSACSSMIGLFSSCVAEIDGFSDLPYGEQASCYCCRTTRGVVTWTDELDEYAQTCRDWARTGEPGTIFPVASTFAVFCDNFSTACDVTSTGLGPANTDGPNPTEEEDNRVTVTVAPDAAAGLMPSAHMAGVIAMAAVVIFL